MLCWLVAITIQYIVFFTSNYYCDLHGRIVNITSMRLQGAIKGRCVICIFITRARGAITPVLFILLCRRPGVYVSNNKHPCGLSRLSSMDFHR